jgi:hypothetical protein
MAIGLEAGSASRNATPLVPPGNLAVAAYLPQRIKGFAPYLPSNAGGTIWGLGSCSGGYQLGPWTGFAVLCGYAVVLAAWRLRRLSTPKAARIQVCPSGRRSRTGNAPAASRAFDIE